MRLGVNGRFLAARRTGVQRFGLEVLRRMIAREPLTLFLPAGAELPAGFPAPARIERGRLAGPLFEQGELPALARRASVDVVLHPANAAPVVGGPHVLVLHDVIPLTRPGDFRPAYRAWVRIAHLRAARRAAAVATVSEWSAAELVAHAGVPRERITVVPQGAAPLDAPAAPDAVRAARARHGLGERYLVAVTGGDVRKGTSFLEEVWEGWGAGGAPELVLVGERHRRVHAGGGAGPSGHACIHVFGHVPDEELRSLLTGAVGLLHPSAAEGFGRPPLEALACGTRVLAAPYGPAREVLGDAADLLPLDPRAWREAIHGLLDEGPDARALRIDAGRARAARFRWDDTVGALLDLCRAHARAGR
jgi:glycosyltransferase involved in cell wall biosynthesis